MGEIIIFRDHFIKSQDCTVAELHRIQGMRRWYFRNRRLMQERDEKLKNPDLTEEKRDEI